MGFRLTLLLCIYFAAIVMALPANERKKRDVMESMKNAWTEVVKTFTDAGDAVVHVFKPTEKSVMDKIADEIKNLTP